MEHDVASTLRSEIAGLQFTKDRLQNDLDDLKREMALRDQRCLELKVEADQLREQVARQNATLGSFRNRIYELEERERNLLISHTRHENTIEATQNDLRYNEEKNKELESKIKRLEFDLSTNEQKKETLKIQFHDFVRRLSTALEIDFGDYINVSLETLIKKAYELIQETGRLRNQVTIMRETINSMEIDLKTSRENLECNLAEKESFQRQCTSQNFEIDKLRQEKDGTEMAYRVLERELNELKNNFVSSSRNLENATENISLQESLICKIRDDLKAKEEKLQRMSANYKHTLETLASILSTPIRYVDSSEAAIKEKIHEILTENNEKTAQLERIREKLNLESQQLSRQISLYDQATVKIRSLEDKKNHLELMLSKAEKDINSYEVSRDGLMRDKSAIMNFLERLAKTLNIGDMSNDIGIDLQTETLLLRAEQLARLENEKIADKVQQDNEDTDSPAVPGISNTEEYNNDLNVTPLGNALLPIRLGTFRTIYTKYMYYYVLFRFK